jgi:Domain of unknown function (DUF6265)
MRAFGIACTGLLLVLGAVRVDSADRRGIEELAWLAGHWAQARNGGRSEELWLPPDAGLMLGLGRSMSREGKREFEWLRIEERSDGVYYIAAPNGGATTEFKLMSLGTTTAQFANPAHDFPNKITYERHDNVLSVTIEGTSGNKPASQSWQWTLQQTLRTPQPRGTER